MYCVHGVFDSLYASSTDNKEQKKPLSTKQLKVTCSNLHRIKNDLIRIEKHIVTFFNLDVYYHIYVYKSKFFSLSTKWCYGN